MTMERVGENETAQHRREMREQDERRKQWAAKRGLRLAEPGPRQPWVCLHWIAHGRCDEEWCREGRGDHHWMDHTTGWTKDGKPALLLCQPYHLGDHDFRDFVNWWTAEDISGIVLFSTNSNLRALNWIRRSSYVDAQSKSRPATVPFLCSARSVATDLFTPPERDRPARRSAAFVCAGESSSGETGCRSSSPWSWWIWTLTEPSTFWPPLMCRSMASVPNSR
jgi:hypothetical protein